LLNLAILEAHFQEEIASELGVQATIDCGSTYRVNRPGDSFECAVANAIAPMSQSDPSNQADPASQTEQTNLANLTNPPDQDDPSTQAEPVLVEVVVNVDQQGNVNWQQIRRVQTAQAADSPTTTAAAPAAASPTANAATTAEQSESATATPSEAQTAEDFLDDPSALDDF